MQFTDTSGFQRITREYSSFSQAAEEAGRSRIYAGIHFQFDNRAGLQSGRAVGRYIFDRHVQPISAPTNDRLVARTANRPTPDNGRVEISQANYQAGTHTTSARPAVTSNSGSNVSPATSYYLPATTYTCPTVVYAGESIVAQYPQNPMLYGEPAVGEYVGVTEPSQSEVTYFYLSGW